MPAPAHRNRLWLLGLAGLALVSLLLAVLGDDILPDNVIAAMDLPIFGHRPAPPAQDALALESFLPGQNRQLSPQQAEAINLATPITRDNPAPAAFNPGWLAPADLTRARDCMASALYYEANGEPAVGQLAVAQVILNRLRHPRYPKTVCDVVYQGAERATGCQFTFACDGSLRRQPDAAGLARASAVADAALHGAVSLLAGQATHYHTVWVVPVWAHELRKVAILGHHVFYRPPGAYPGWTLALATPSPQPTPTASVMAPMPMPVPSALSPAPAKPAASRDEEAPGPAHAATAAGATPGPAPRDSGYFGNTRQRSGALPLAADR